MSVVTETVEVGVMSRGKGVRLGEVANWQVYDRYFCVCDGNAVLKIRLKLAPLNSPQPPTRPLIFHLMLLSVKLLAWPPGASSLRPV